MNTVYHPNKNIPVFTSHPQSGALKAESRCRRLPIPKLRHDLKTPRVDFRAGYRLCGGFSVVPNNKLRGHKVAVKKDKSQLG